jgi:hypothetical protein
MKIIIVYPYCNGLALHADEYIVSLMYELLLINQSIALYYVVS